MDVEKYKTQRKFTVVYGLPLDPETKTRLQRLKAFDVNPNEWIRDLIASNLTALEQALKK